jgi:hypothetical protein
MSTFCSLDEAFTGPVVAPPGDKKKKKTKDGKIAEGFVPSPLAGSPDPDRILGPSTAPEPMRGPPQTHMGKLESEASLGDMFPLPGSTAEAEEWQKAFMLEGSQVPQPVPPKYMRPDGSVPVNGGPTLWRQQAAAAAPVSATVVSTDITKRLDQLTAQLETLTVGGGGTPVQNTAELFLFVAIGLLLLLAIDTLLRFATSMVTRQQSGGGGGVRKAYFPRRYRIGGKLFV